MHAQTWRVRTLSLIIRSLLSLKALRDVWRLCTLSVSCFFSDSKNIHLFLISKVCLLNSFPASSDKEFACASSCKKKCTHTCISTSYIIEINKLNKFHMMHCYSISAIDHTFIDGAVQKTIKMT